MTDPLPDHIYYHQHSKQNHYESQSFYNKGQAQSIPQLTNDHVKEQHSNISYQQVPSVNVGSNRKVTVIVILPSDEQQLLQDIDLKLDRQSNSVLFSSLVLNLMIRQYSIQFCRVLYYHPRQNIYAYLGYVGQKQDALIPNQAMHTGRLYIKIRPPSMLSSDQVKHLIVESKDQPVKNCAKEEEQEDEQEDDDEDEDEEEEEEEEDDENQFENNGSGEYNKRNKDKAHSARKQKTNQYSDIYFPGINGSLPPPPILNKNQTKGSNMLNRTRGATASGQELVDSLASSSNPPFIIPGENTRQKLTSSQMELIQSIAPQQPQQAQGVGQFPQLSDLACIKPETNLNQELKNISKITKRTKQRRIGEIIEKVSLWRKLYNGISDGKGNIIRFSLEDAAQKVGISKKSLDDYLLQMRFGRRFKFDFNKHRQDKVGLLRSFVRKMKNKEKEQKAKNKKSKSSSSSSKPKSKKRSRKKSSKNDEVDEEEEEEENEEQEDQEPQSRNQSALECKEQSKQQIHNDYGIELERMFQDSQSSFNPANSVINNGIMPPNGNYIHQTLIQSLDAGDASQISAFSRVLPSYKPQRSSTLNDQDIQEANHNLYKKHKQSQDELISNMISQQSNNPFANNPMNPYYLQQSQNSSVGLGNDTASYQELFQQPRNGVKIQDSLLSLQFLKSSHNNRLAAVAAAEYQASQDSTKSNKGYDFSGIINGMINASYPHPNSSQR